MTTVLGPDAAQEAPPSEPAAAGDDHVIDIDLDKDETIEEQLAAQSGKIEKFVDGALRPTPDQELFEGKQFEVKATIDGETADKIQISYSGTQVLESNEPKDVAFFEKMFLGRKLTLMVEVEVVDKTGKIKTDKNDETTITGIAKLKVIHVYEPTPEEL